MHHARRKRLMTDDFDKALKWSRIEPLHGNQTGCPTHFSPTQNPSVFIVEDHELNLTAAAFENPMNEDSKPDTPHVEASWLSIEGVSLGNTSGDQDQSFVELKREINEPNEKYLSVLMEALTGDKEDLRRVALTDLQKNTAIANILPDIIAYLQETLQSWPQYTPQQLTHLLKLSLALFQNSHLYLEPHFSSVYPGLKSILFDTSYLVCTEEIDHWAVRELAAVSMATLLHRCGPLTGSVSDLHLSLHQLLSSPDPLLPSLYGAVLTLCYLAGDSLLTVLYPHLEELVNTLHRLLNGNVPPSYKEDALRVYETLLLGAELLLTCGHYLEETQPSSPTPPPTDPKPSQPSLPKEPGGLFANTSFSLTSETSDMEIEHGSTQIDPTQRVGKNEEKIHSMYHHLTELFGESLLLRLSTRPQFMAPSPTPTPPKHTLPDCSHKKGSHTSPALLSFLSEEGFKPLKVELPVVNTPQPSRRSYVWSLTVPKTKLPVQRNILEEKSREAKHLKHHGLEKRPPLTGQGVSKGTCASYRRHNCRTGLENVSVQSAWL